MQGQEKPCQTDNGRDLEDALQLLGDVELNTQLHFLPFAGLDQTALLQELKARSGNLRTSLQGLVRDTQLSVLTSGFGSRHTALRADGARKRTHCERNSSTRQCENTFSGNPGSTTSWVRSVTIAQG